MGTIETRPASSVSPVAQVARGQGISSLGSAERRRANKKEKTLGLDTTIGNSDMTPATTFFPHRGKALAAKLN